MGQKVHPEAMRVGYIHDWKSNWFSERNFAEYLAVDKEIRRLEMAGKHREAIELCVGDKPGQSDWAFERFDKAVDATLAINQQAFDVAVSRGLASLDGSK